MRLSVGVLARLLLGDVLFWWGVGLLGAGLVGAVGTFPLIDYRPWAFRQPLAHTSGTIVAVTNTRWSKGEQEDTRGAVGNIWAITYRFRHDGRAYQGCSYSTRLEWEPGQLAPVEYVSSRPNYSRLVGTDYRPYSLWVLPVVVLMPLAGLLLRGALRRFGTACQYLRHGTVVVGSCPTPTAQQVDNAYVKGLTYNYRHGGRTFQQTFGLIPKRPLCQQEYLLLLPDRPRAAWLVASLPLAAQHLLLAGRPPLTSPPVLPDEP